MLYKHTNETNMNSKSVLSKILTLLSLDEVKFTDAKDAQGQILQSPTFDLDEMVEIVHEDGTKTTAPDGEYEISLKDESGNENIIRIEVKDGKISERANVEEDKNEEEDMEKPNEEVVDKEADKVAEEKDVTMADATTEVAKGLPNTTDEDKVNEVPEPNDNKEVISLAYRIAELEKMLKEVKAAYEEANPVTEEGTDINVAPSANDVAMAAEEVEEEEEEELPKLDGAPVEAGVKFSADAVHKPNYGKKVGDSQSSFLSKLYN